MADHAAAAATLTVALLTNSSENQRLRATDAPAQVVALYMQVLQRIRAADKGGA